MRRRGRAGFRRNVGGGAGGEDRESERPGDDDDADGEHVQHQEEVPRVRDEQVAQRGHVITTERRRACSSEVRAPFVRSAATGVADLFRASESKRVIRRCC